MKSEKFKINQVRCVGLDELPEGSLLREEDLKITWGCGIHQDSMVLIDPRDVAVEAERHLLLDLQKACVELIERNALEESDFVWVAF